MPCLKQGVAFILLFFKSNNNIVVKIKIDHFFLAAVLLLAQVTVFAQTKIDVAKAFADAASQYNLMLTTHPDITQFPQSLKPDGTINNRNSNWWCSGFFGGSLWYLFEYTKDSSWKNAAHRWSMAVEKEKFNKGTHDLGFMLYCPFGNGYRLTKNKQYKEIMLTGAASLATRFNPNYGVIKSWDGWKGYDYPVIVDNMMNLEFLFWAAKASGNKKLYDLSVTHADNTLKNHFRKDYSSYHVVCYGEGGKVLAQKTHQGVADSSAWSRGQGWGLYGYTVMYRETKQKKYLLQAERIADFILNHPNLPEDKIPYWDFDAPNIPNEERDVSAAAVISSALFELSQYSKANNKTYFDAAVTMLSNLTTPTYKAAIGTNGNFILKHSVGSKPHNSEVDVPLVYADYYYLEALLRYQTLTENNKLSAKKNTVAIIKVPFDKTKLKLVFQTGFEGTSAIVADTKNIPSFISQGYVIDDITGADNTLKEKNNWEKDLDNNPNAGQFLIEYTGGDSTQRYVKIIPEPGNPANHVMHFWLNDSWHATQGKQKARIQTDIYGVPKGFKEIYQTQRLFLTADFNLLKNYPGKFSWLTISEFWNNEWWVKEEKYGFRTTLGIEKPLEGESDLYFKLDAENAGQKQVWNAGNQPKVKVPIGKWFTMEYYLKEGDDKTGRFYMTITPDGEQQQLVFDVTNFTHNTSDPAPNGFTGWSPQKLYTSKEVIGFVKSKGGALQIYWDDFKLWREQ